MERTLLSVLGILLVTLLQSTNAAHFDCPVATPAATGKNGCTRQVKKLDACAAGQQLIGGKCYPKCKAGYMLNGTSCIQPCPTGFPAAGTDRCNKPANYTRPGPAFLLDNGADGPGGPTTAQLAQACADAYGSCDVCGEPVPKHGCTPFDGTWLFPSCKAGFVGGNVNCCHCVPNCGALKDLDTQCQRASYSLGAGVAPSACATAGGYFKHCTLCWQPCPTAFPEACGRFCSTATADCIKIGKASLNDPFTDWLYPLC